MPIQPPFRVTGDPNADWIVFFVGFIICLYWLKALRLARAGARRFLRNLARVVLVFFGVTFLLAAIRFRTHFQPEAEQFVSGLVALVLFAQWQGKKRSRYISKAVRRAVIARDLKGEEYDPQKHHIDHVWPFSKGGSNTSDNLRVIKKKKNLKKGAKRPRMRDMW